MHAHSLAVQLPPTLVPLVGGATPSPGVQLAPWPRRTGLGASGAEEADSASVPEGPDGGWTRASSGGAAAASAMLGTDAFGRGPGAERGTLRPPPEDLAPGEATLSVFIGGWAELAAAQHRMLVRLRPAPTSNWKVTVW
jgi:hypothetical protein